MISRHRQRSPALAALFSLSRVYSAQCASLSLCSPFIKHIFLFPHHCNGYRSSLFLSPLFASPLFASPLLRTALVCSALPFRLGAPCPPVCVLGAGPAGSPVVVSDHFSSFSVPFRCFVKGRVRWEQALQNRINVKV